MLGGLQKNAHGLMAALGVEGVPSHTIVEALYGVVRSYGALDDTTRLEGELQLGKDRGGMRCYEFAAQLLEHVLLHREGRLAVIRVSEAPVLPADNVDQDFELGALGFFWALKHRIDAQGDALKELSGLHGEGRLVRSTELGRLWASELARLRRRYWDRRQPVPQRNDTALWAALEVFRGDRKRLASLRRHHSDDEAFQEQERGFSTLTGDLFSSLFSTSSASDGTNLSAGMPWVSPYHAPPVFLPQLTPQAVWRLDESAYLADLVEALESNFAAFRPELETLIDDPLAEGLGKPLPRQTLLEGAFGASSTVTRLRGYAQAWALQSGHARRWTLLQAGVWDSELCQRLLRVCGVLRRRLLGRRLGLPEIVEDNEEVTLWELEPNTATLLRVGETNGRVNLHLGLHLPRQGGGVQIMVPRNLKDREEEVRMQWLPWREGRVTEVFEDGYDHSLLALGEQGANAERDADGEEHWTQGANHSEPAASTASISTRRLLNGS